LGKISGKVHRKRAGKGGGGEIRKENSKKARPISKFSGDKCVHRKPSHRSLESHKRGFWSERYHLKERKILRQRKRLGKVGGKRKEKKKRPPYLGTGFWDEVSEEHFSEIKNF